MLLRNQGHSSNMAFSGSLKIRHTRTHLKIRTHDPDWMTQAMAGIMGRGWACFGAE